MDKVELRDCLKRSGMRQPTHHQPGHREVDHRFAAGGQDFVVFAQPAAAASATRTCARRSSASAAPESRAGHPAAAPAPSETTAARPPSAAACRDTSRRPTLCAASCSRRPVGRHSSRAPAASEVEAAVTTTASSKPSVSTRHMPLAAHDVFAFVIAAHAGHLGRLDVNRRPILPTRRRQSWFSVILDDLSRSGGSCRIIGRYLPAGISCA